ncbi:hypothetical protein E0W68_11190 [Flavobacterium salilacus subsp. salilacus]|uniref:DUF6495 family protein n=1 Tax=Flavobacterium TaxID=237 RepID=UPI0010753E41|nr:MULTISPECIES: DUF6495 family protein [Flavobacterium]KAF2517526.1 hypothetical protein E0W68_11190 [Flavobacterium salilacus subsp. salilacus]MBE1615674.1 hypothetical protein [Flavobacterium sp. SaA2.13]
MKYTRLTKEQLEELHPEFTRFLASQQIDKTEWDTVKENQPEVAEQVLDVFSDMVWEAVLDKAEWLEHYSKNHIFLFKLLKEEMESIVIHAHNSNIDFLTQEGLIWLNENIFSEEVKVTRGKKPFGEDRNTEVFELIQQGTILTEGTVYKQFEDMF